MNRKTDTGYNAYEVTADDCLKALLDEEKDRLWDNRKVVDFKAGENIIREGFVASNILFLEEGLVRLDVIVDGHHSAINLIGPGSFIGLLCAFAGYNLVCSARALESSRVWLFDLRLFESLIHQNGNFAGKITRHMSVVTSHIVHRLARFKDKQIDGALAVLLLEFSQLYGSLNYILPVNRKEMAEMLGYSKESVINAISGMNREGTIEVSGRHITILREEKLKKVAQTG